MTLSAGSFDGVVPRGDDRIRGLSTTYGGIPFDRITYAGIDTTIFGVTSALYAGHSNDLWNQYYVSLSKNVAIGNDSSLTGRIDSYITRASGARSEGDIDNRSASLSLTVQRGASSVLLG